MDRLHQPTRLTDDRSANWNPAWAPAGDRIAFVSDTDGHSNIYTMNSRGSDVRRLTKGDSDHDDPAWSPLGDRIAFVSRRWSKERGEYDQDIYVMNADGSNVARLTTGGENSAPSFSPNGNWIAFSCMWGADPMIYTISANGGDAERLASVPEIIYERWFSDEPGALYGKYMIVEESDPQWSPDGRSIALVIGYNALRDPYVYGGRVMLHRGRTWVIAVAAWQGASSPFLWGPEGTEPCWSPDGKLMAFISGGTLCIDTVAGMKMTAPVAR